MKPAPNSLRVTNSNAEFMGKTWDWAIIRSLIIFRHIQSWSEPHYGIFEAICGIWGRQTKAHKMGGRAGGGWWAVDVDWVEGRKWHKNDLRFFFLQTFNMAYPCSTLQIYKYTFLVRFFCFIQYHQTKLPELIHDKIALDKHLMFDKKMQFFQCNTYSALFLRVSL